MMPEQERAAPMNNAFRDLGRRISNIILRNTSESPPEKSSAGDIITLPVEIDSMNEMKNNITRVINILKFRVKLINMPILVAKNKNILTNKG